jgi:hypothetical protein
LTALVVTALMTAVLVGVALSPTKSAVGLGVSCAPRVIVVDLSSSARSPKISGLASDVIEAAAKSAIVCGDDLSAYGVSGGGEESVILTNDDLASFTPIGPNAQVREVRLTSEDQTDLANLITRRLSTAYSGEDPRVTSIAAMYDIAAQQSSAGSQVVFITTGVNEDQTVNLNQPFGTGEGVALARRVDIPQLRAQSVTEVGVAQVDSTTPPPSAQWPQEVLSFNVALCRASGVKTCRVFDLASPSQVLNP